MSNLIIKLNGEIQSSNFHEWKDGLIEQIQSAQLALKTDNDFATAELNVKTFKIAETTLKHAKESAIQQASDIQELFNAIDEVAEQARQARLTLERQIKKRKNEVKEELALEGVDKITKELGRQSTDFNLVDNSAFTDKSVFLSSIKGARGVSGARNAVELLCSKMKDMISEKALWIKRNATTIDTIQMEYSALFQDRAYLIGLPHHDLNQTIDIRINQYIDNQKTISKNPTIRNLSSVEVLNDDVNGKKIRPILNCEYDLCSVLQLLIDGVDYKTGEMFDFSDHVITSLKQIFLSMNCKLNNNIKADKDIKDCDILTGSFSDIYLEAKKKYPKHIVFIQNGYYLETLYEDAVLISKTLDYKLFERSKGVPHSGFKGDIDSLKELGLPFAFVEQLPGGSPGNIKRFISQVYDG